MNQVATQSTQPTLKDMLAKPSALAAISKALPKHMNADRMMRLALTAYGQSEQLRKCSVNSIWSSLLTASQLGLEPGVNGQGYLIPYKTTCTFVPGWKGINDLANRSGRSSTWTGAVFEGDHFEYSLGTNPHIDHKPADESDPSKLLYTYAVGRAKGSDYPIIEVWSNSRLKKHFQKNNKVGDRHYAHGNWEMYCRKIVLLQVLKYMPQSIEMSLAIEASHASESGTNYTIDGDVVIMDTAEQTQNEAPASNAKGNDAAKAAFAAKAGGVSLATLEDEMRQTTGRDGGVLLLDEGRSALAPADYEALQAVFNEMYPA